MKAPSSGLRPPSPQGEKGRTGREKKGSMRILHVMASRANGGAETYSADMMESLHRAGIDQLAVIPRASMHHARLEAAGVRLGSEVLDARLGLVRWRRLAALIETEKPDLVHCWMRRAASLMPRLDVPVIGWFGGYYDPARFRPCSHFVGVTPGIVAHMVANGVPSERAHYVPTFPTIDDGPAVDRAALGDAGGRYGFARPVAAAREEGPRRSAAGACRPARVRRLDRRRWPARSRPQGAGRQARRGRPRALSRLAQRPRRAAESRRHLRAAVPLRAVRHGHAGGLGDRRAAGRGSEPGAQGPDRRRRQRTAGAGRRCACPRRGDPAPSGRCRAQGPLDRTGPGGLGGNAVDVEVYGFDFAATNEVANELSAKIKNIKGTKDVTISRDKSKPELQIIFDQEKMSANGLNTAMVANVVKNRVDGMIATRLRQSGDEYDVVVRFKKSSRSTLTDVENFGVTNTMGQVIRLGEIAQVKEYWSPPNIERKRKERIVRVSFTPFERSLTDIQTDVEKAIAETPKPAGVMVQISGAIKEQTEAFMDLSLLLLVSLILVYLVMASQFESLKMPFIIMFSIPFAFSGVAIALFLTSTTLSVISGIGAVLLIGIVVKNAIVLVDFINLMRDRGNELYEAIALSGRSRLRPVLMTSLTTILGMLPLSLSTGSGSELWKPMGIAVIGGLIFSTVVTLVIVPVVYAIFVKAW